MDKCYKCGREKWDHVKFPTDNMCFETDGILCNEIQIANLTAERDKLGAQAVSAVEAVCVLHKEKAAILAERDRLKGLLAELLEIEDNGWSFRCWGELWCRVREALK